MDPTTLDNLNLGLLLFAGVISPHVFRGMVLVILYFIATKMAA